MRGYVFLALIPLAACTAGTSAPPSGAAANRNFTVDGFNEVNASGPDDVDVRVGGGFSIHAVGDPKLLDKLEIVKNGGALEVRRKSTAGFSWGGDNGDGVKVYITMPRITAATTTGSGDLTVDRVAGDSFTASAKGSGALNIATLAVQVATFSLTGSGSVTTGGTAQTGEFSVTGSGDIDAAKLKVSQASVNVMGSGSVSATVTGPATVKVMGSGDVTLTGGAKCTISKLGPGDVTCS